MHAFAIVALISGLLVAGCTSLSVDERLAQDKVRCSKIGVEPDTDGMRGCLIEFEAARRHGTSYSWSGGEDDRLADDRETCSKIGLAPGSDQMRNCVVELEAARLHRGRSAVR